MAKNFVNRSTIDRHFLLEIEETFQIEDSKTWTIPCVFEAIIRIFKLSKAFHAR